MARQGFSGFAPETQDPLFDSAWFKWAQAIVHAEALQADIEARRGDGATYPVLAFRTEYQPKRHGFAVIIEDVAPIPVRWRLVLGDMASNYRAALDHLAWALVCRGRTPPAELTADAEKAIYFPILQDRTGFNGELPIKLPGVRRADVAKVRRRQPYHKGKRSRSRHALLLLSRINNGDKHRAIQPLWAVSTETVITITEAQDCTPSNRLPRIYGPLYQGAELAFLHARKTGENPKLQVKLQVTAEPTLNNLIGVKDWSGICWRLIAGLLREFSPQPPEISEVGARLRYASPGEIKAIGG
jgi:hypothetical protein